jgi:hypothetical protein
LTSELSNEASPQVTATPEDFTWTGGALPASGHWSSATNWLGGKAPTPNTTIGTVAYTPSGCCDLSQDDVSGLTIGKIEAINAEEDGITGDAFTLGAGGIVAEPANSPGGLFSIANPIMLATSQTWTIGGTDERSPEFEDSGPLSGEQSNLTVNITNTSGASFDDPYHLTSPNDEIGDFEVNGTERTSSGGFVERSLILLGAGKFNREDDHPLIFNHVELQNEAETGPITLNHSAMTFGGSATGPVIAIDSELGPYGVSSLPSLSMDASSEFSVHIEPSGTEAGADYDQLTASGAVSLNGSQLHLWATGNGPPGNECPPRPAGQVLTLISTTGTLSGAFGNAPNEGTVSAHCEDFEGFGQNAKITSERNYAYRINYNTGASPETVTATVVADEEGSKVEGARSEGSAIGGTPTSPPGTASVTISSALVTNMLLQQLAPSGKAVTINALLKHGGLSMPFTALEPGSLVVDWYKVPPSAKLAKTKVKPVLVASGYIRFSTAETGTVRLKLTKAGQRILKHASRLRLTAKATFSPTGKAPLSTKKTFSLPKK